MNKNFRKLDLLQDCYNPAMGGTPREFMATFCKRCRNGGCVNSGWSESKWSDRMGSQADRLLRNPVFGDPDDPAFRDLKSLLFREIPAPLVISGRDPWEPQTHLADPPREVTSHPEVERAISALAEVRGVKPPPPPRAIEASQKSEVESPPPPSPPPRPNPAHFQEGVSVPRTREANTAFPSEGVMLDGSPPPPSPSTGPAQGPVPDPWAAPTSPAPRKVSVGAKVKMGG